MNWLTVAACLSRRIEEYVRSRVRLQLRRKVPENFYSVRRRNVPRIGQCTTQLAPSTMFASLQDVCTSSSLSDHTCNTIVHNFCLTYASTCWRFMWSYRALKVFCLAHHSLAQLLLSLSCFQSSSFLIDVVSHVQEQNVLRLYFSYKVTRRHGLAFSGNDFAAASCKEIIMKFSIASWYFCRILLVWVGTLHTWLSGLVCITQNIVVANLQSVHNWTNRNTPLLHL